MSIVQTLVDSFSRRIVAAEVPSWSGGRAIGQCEGNGNATLNLQLQSPSALGHSGCDPYNTGHLSWSEHANEILDITGDHGLGTGTLHGSIFVCRAFTCLWAYSTVNN